MYRKKNYISTYNKYLKSIGHYDLISEIKYTGIDTLYKKQFDKNDIFTNEYNYYFIFKCDSNIEYILQFDYYKDIVGSFIGYDLYNVSFTTYDQYLRSLLAKKEIQQEEIYEEQTNNNETTELMKRLVYIFQDFHDNINPHKKSVYVVGETKNPVKIRWYRNLIKDSIINIKEVKSESSINKGKPVYYFYI